jgi:transitional endoplasmic reticulum ATPase
VRDMVELPLTHADLFAQMGIHDAGGGIILAGLPGTGKTLLARAVAGESKAHIEIVAGPELLSKWFGESERQLRAIFNRARELQPSIILFDELDGIAGTRNGDSYHRTFVAQLLTLLDGLDDRGRVFAIATTNRPSDIDPALLRPGRFDRVIYMGLPNESGRVALFNHHTKPLKLSSDMETARLAAVTPNFSGAQIAYACRRAGVICIKEAIKKETLNQDMLITMEHFLQAIGEIQPTFSSTRPVASLPLAKIS